MTPIYEDLNEFEVEELPKVKNLTDQFEKQLQKVRAKIEQLSNKLQAKIKN